VILDWTENLIFVFFWIGVISSCVLASVLLMETSLKKVGPKCVAVNFAKTDNLEFTFFFQEKCGIQIWDKQTKDEQIWHLGI